MTDTGSVPSRSYWLANGLGALLDVASRSHRGAAALLILASLIAFLPGFFQIAPVDRDEAYFAQATKQMIETGDYVNIRYQNDVRYRKPVGIYWLQAAVVKTALALGMKGARTTIWLYRVPSLIGSIGAVLATYWCALAFVGGRAAFLAALMMATSVALGVEAHLAKTDAVLLFASVVAMGGLARAYLLPRAAALAGAPTSSADEARLHWHLPALFWTAMAVGILIKGPLIVMFVALAALALSILDRSARWLKKLRPLPGFLWMCLLVLPWFVAIYVRVGNAFFVDAVGHDMLAKIGHGQETHGGPPGYYLLLFFLTFFPGSMLAVLAAPSVWAKRSAAGVRFLLAWLVPSWIVFELVATKLPHYVLPLYPAIAILIAGAIETKALSQRRSLVRGMIWWFIIPLVLAVGAVVVSIALNRNLALAAWPFLAGAIVCSLFAWRLYEADGAERSLMRAACAAILIAVGVYGVVIPSLAPVFPSVALANVLRGAACNHPLAASAGYEEPSLVFLSGTGTHLTDAAGAADFLRKGECRFAFIEAAGEGAFARRAEAIGLHYRSDRRVTGYNISTGKRVAISVFQSAGNP